MNTNVTPSNNTTSEPRTFNWNDLFRGDPKRTSWNACVGNNGNPDIYYYADGFADSVFMLIENLTSRRGGTIDTLIYPICFNLRHSVELTLKGMIGELAELVAKRGNTLTKNVDDVIGKHDIGNLWDFFVQNANATDKRFNTLLSQADNLMKCIAATDPTGQTFRYSLDTNSIKHLTDVSLINVLVLREQFEILRGHLSNISSFMAFITEEYNTGTFTRNLNREDIISIAQLLPLRHLWGSPEVDMNALKNAIRTKYVISNNELTTALNFVQNVRDMARIIGISTQVPGLAKQDLKTLNDIWKTAWNLEVLEQKLREEIYGTECHEKVPDPVLLEEAIEEIISASKDLSGARTMFTQWATPERVAGLCALLDSRMYSYSEEYDRMYRYFIRIMNAAKSSGPDAWEAELGDVWSRSLARENYVLKIINKLKYAGFTEESTVLTDDLFS